MTDKDPRECKHTAQTSEEDMKARRISTGEEVEVTELTYTNMKTNVICRRDTKNGGFIAESDLELLTEESPESATIVGYIARDKSGYLVLHYARPHITRGGGKWYAGQSQKSLPKESFPSLTFENSPKKVRITITPIEDE